MTGDDRLVVVARIVSPFSRFGEVKALLETDFPERFAERERFYLTKDGLRGELKKVQSVRFHKGAALIKFEGVDSINDAEELRGLLVAVSLDDRAELDENSYWMSDIIGLEAVYEDGGSLGKITEVLRTKANDVWVTPLAMIPVVSEFVLKVDLEAGIVTVRRVDGLETA